MLLLFSLPVNNVLRKDVNRSLLINSKWYRYEAEFGQSHYDFQDIIDSPICQLYDADK